MNSKSFKYYTSQKQKDIVEYVAKMYSHILFGMGEVSGKRFADEIRKNYLMTELKHQVCADHAERYIVSISYTPRGVKAKFDFSSLN